MDENEFDDCDSYDDESYDDQFSDDNHNDVDEDDFQVEEEDSAVGTKRSPTQVITPESLLAAQEEDLGKVIDMFSLKEHHARTLLIHYRWDVEKLLTMLVERGREAVCEKAGVPVFECDRAFSSEASSSDTCNICIEDAPVSEFSVNDCGHYFCNSCWTEHFVVKINEGQSRHITCMEYKCKAVCDNDIVRRLIRERDPDLAEKFDRFLLESYIDDNRMVKWCPSAPHCGNAIRVKDDPLREVECVCGFQFCFNCSYGAHSPCSCLLWELWNKKCADESETVNWITANTKPCPKCHKLVEKNGGCNLVVCLCGQAFCWLCGGATGRNHTWNSIENHSCGRYKEEAKAKAELANRYLARYIHYYNRYKAHLDSFNLECKHRETMNKKIVALENSESANKDFSWLIDGLHRRFISRRILLCSYPFAYYMFSDEVFKDEMTEKERQMRQNLFEDQQQQLEANVEKLSLLLQEPMDEYADDKHENLRLKLFRSSTITDNLCKKLYEVVENDLLGSLQRSTQYIAPYLSNGIEKAVELSVRD